MLAVAGSCALKLAAAFVLRALLGASCTMVVNKVETVIASAVAGRKKSSEGKLQADAAVVRASSRKQESLKSWADLGEDLTMKLPENRLVAATATRKAGDQRVSDETLSFA